MQETIFKSVKEAEEYYRKHVSKNGDEWAFKQWLDRIERMGKLKVEKEEVPSN